MGKEADPDDPKYWPDGSETYPADDKALAGYQQAREQLTRFSAPVLADGAHGRVWIAAFDGTWNDKDKDAVDTNVARIYEQIQAAQKQGLRDVSGSYQPGVGTQNQEFIQNADGLLGYSYGPRMEQMYYDFCVQAKRWLDEDPDARISVATVGFSRGAVIGALFTRMIEERGIMNPDDMVVNRDVDGRVSSVLPLRPNLVEPGRTPQIVGLFDPVATGVLNHVDVRLPPSVVSGFQITALDERRDAFLAKQIIDPGMSADGRFLAVQVAGAHSDIGGGYRLDGLPIRNGNLMISYLNSTSDAPYLSERTVPTAPEMNVIHRSEQHRSIYTTQAADLFGQRHAIERLAAPATSAFGALRDLVRDPNAAEPRNEELRRGLRFQPIRVEPERPDPVLPSFFRTRSKPNAVESDHQLTPQREPVARLDQEARSDPLLVALWAQLPPGTSREKAEEVKLAAKIGGIERVEQLERIAYRADDPRAFVLGTTPGFRAAVDLSVPAPPLAQTRANEEQHDREQAVMWERFEQQQAQLNQDGLRMSLGGMKLRGPGAAPSDPGQPLATQADGGGGGEG